MNSDESFGLGKPREGWKGGARILLLKSTNGGFGNWKRQAE